jgi:hypothetical protein
MPSDPDPRTSILQRATGRLDEAGVLRPPPVAVLQRRAHRLHVRRRAGAAGAIVAFSAVVGAAALTRSDTGHVVSGGYGAGGAPATAAPSPTAVSRAPADLIVYMHPNVTQGHIDGARIDLGRLPGIRGIVFVNHQQAYEELKERFRDSPEMIGSVKPELLPTSFRIDAGGEREAIDRIRVQAANMAGVREVVVPDR